MKRKRNSGTLAFSWVTLSSTHLVEVRAAQTIGLPLTAYAMETEGRRNVQSVSMELRLGQLEGGRSVGRLSLAPSSASWPAVAAFY